MWLAVLLFRWQSRHPHRQTGRQLRSQSCDQPPPVNYYTYSPSVGERFYMCVVRLQQEAQEIRIMVVRWYPPTSWLCLRILFTSVCDMKPLPLVCREKFFDFGKNILLLLLLCFLSGLLAISFYSASPQTRNR